jgi:hypothetical protein
MVVELVLGCCAAIDGKENINGNRFSADDTGAPIHSGYAAGVLADP